MRHIPDGVLRRLDDEPLAVPDKLTDHLDSCERCGARRAAIAYDTERATQLLAAPQLLPDADLAWVRIRRELDRGPSDAKRRRPAVVRSRPAWAHRVSLRTGLAIGAVGIAVAGTAAASTLTNVFAPTRVAPLSVTRNDLQAIAAVAGLGDSQALGGFTTPAGSSTLRFGALTWSSGPPVPTSSLAVASVQAGFPVHLPSHLPAGVAAVSQLMVQPQLTATVTFNSSAATLTGSSVSVNAGPAVLAQYPAAGGSGVPALAVATMRRPTAQSTGASLDRIKAFLLTQPGVPPQLTEEIRLLGNLTTTLPVPVPSGASVRSVRIAGWPGVLVTDGSHAAAGVIWEDGQGLLHAVVGILDSKDVLNVARQLS